MLLHAANKLLRALAEAKAQVASIMCSSTYLTSKTRACTRSHRTSTDWGPAQKIAGMLETQVGTPTLPKLEPISHIPGKHPNLGV